MLGQFRLSLSLLLSLAGSLAAFRCNSLAELDSWTSPCHEVDVREMTINELHNHFRLRRLTCVQVVTCYLRRIQHLNPYLRAVIETNPEALAIASQLDREFDKDSKQELGLFCVPILVKDNIGAGDSMETSAGAHALVGIKPKAENIAITRLKAKGAIILGKSNLSELSGFLSAKAPPGFSARGGLTRNPYNLTASTYGSSSGSAVAVAANLCMGALGTETDGSIITPSSVAGVVGFKPTFGSTNNVGIVPVARTMDTLGVMTRTATDNALITSIVTGQKFNLTQAAQLPNAALKGLRLGVLRDPYFEFQEVANYTNQINATLSQMETMGIALVDGLSFNKTSDFRVNGIIGAMTEFKPQMAQYLLTEVTHPTASPARHGLHSIAEFNRDNPKLRKYDQRLLQYALSTDGYQTDSYQKGFLELRSDVTSLLTALMKRDRLDAIAVPSHPTAFAFTPPALAGFPIISVPIGTDLYGVPIGLSFYSLKDRELVLLRLASSLEKIKRPQPTFLARSKHFCKESMPPLAN